MASTGQSLIPPSRCSDAHTDAISAWTLLASAVMTDSGTRDQLIQGAWTTTSHNVTRGPFFDHYNATSGVGIDGYAG